jgi:hypothetical protein
MMKALKEEGTLDDASPKLNLICLIFQRLMTNKYVRQLLNSNPVRDLLLQIGKHMGEAGIEFEGPAYCPR